MTKSPGYTYDTENLSEDVDALLPLRHSRTRLVTRAAELCGLSLEELLGPVRIQFISCKRWRAGYLLREIGYSYPKIGRMMNRDHSTVVHGVRRFKQAIKEKTPS